MMCHPYSPPSSHCWMSQTQTVRPTVRPHNSIRKTRGSTRREWRPSWSRAGWTSELLSFSTQSLPSSSAHYPITSIYIFFLPHPPKNPTISEELKCHSEKKKGGIKKKKNSREQPNQNGHKLACQHIWGKRGRRGIDLFLCSLSSLLLFLFFYCMMWNKLLLTECVIYPCCLVGFSWTVSFFWVLQIFLLKMFSFFWNVCWWVQRGCFGKGRLMTTSVSYLESHGRVQKKPFFSELVSFLFLQRWPQMLLIKNKS